MSSRSRRGYEKNATSNFFIRRLFRIAPLFWLSIIAYTWVGGTGEAGVPPTLDTVVSFTLEPHPDGTRLRLEHTGFSGMTATLISFMMGAGWKKMMRGRFPALLDGMTPGGAFATVKA